jgi:hypothetical protein
VNIKDFYDIIKNKDIDMSVYDNKIELSNKIINKVIYHLGYKLIDLIVLQYELIISLKCIDFYNACDQLVQKNIEFFKITYDKNDNIFLSDDDDEIFVPINILEIKRANNLTIKQYFESQLLISFRELKEIYNDMCIHLKYNYPMCIEYTNNFSQTHCYFSPNSEWKDDLSDIDD